MADVGHSIDAQKEGLPEQERRGRAFMAVYLSVLSLATLAFVLLVIFVRSEDVIVNFDAPVARAIQAVQWPVGGWVLTHTSDLGWHPDDVLCVVLIALTLFALRLRLESVVVVASTLLAGGLGTVAKDVVQRARPTATFVHLAAHLADFSFPSGHVIFATVLFGTTFWIVWTVWSSSCVRNVVLVLLALPVLLMGPSRVYLGEHWPTDVLGAYCLAGLWVAGTAELILVLKPRLNPWWQGRAHRRRRPARR
ncbi:MAG: phosphatase PAP2 family protein [Chloroflexi bacterium]|nr:MAG: phosphatase PAP2 family protein [Chloroflexota bacterium]